jgi:hypothetical protein
MAALPIQALSVYNGAGRSTSNASFTLKRYKMAGENSFPLCIQALYYNTEVVRLIHTHEVVRLIRTHEVVRLIRTHEVVRLIRTQYLESTISFHSS